MNQINIFEHNLSSFALSKIRSFTKKNNHSIVVHKISSKELNTINGGYLFLQVDNIKDLHNLKLALNYNISTVVLLSNIDLVRKVIRKKLKGLLIIPFEYSELLEVIKDLSKECQADNEEMMQAMSNKTKDPIQIPNAEKITNTLPIMTRSKDHNLTLREIELLSTLSSGFLYKEIATQKGITIGTVKQHLHKIYNKLKVNNRIEAINYMVSAGHG